MPPRTPFAIAQPLDFANAAPPCSASNPRRRCDRQRARDLRARLLPTDRGYFKLGLRRTSAARPLDADCPVCPDDGRPEREINTLCVARAVLQGVVVSLPRPVVPGKFYLITRRSAQRQFLLRPDRATNEVCEYCLAEAAARFGIEIVVSTMMSNHHHTVVYDRFGRINEFTQHFHRLVAKAINVVRGRRENLWSSTQVSVVELVDREDVLDKCVYAATNPVKDGLVERASQWPGLTGVPRLLNGRSKQVRRPRQYFREHGTMPATATLEFVVPPELGEPEQVRRELRERIHAVERDWRDRRARSGQRVLGRRQVLRQSWRGCPADVEPRRRVRPTVAAREREARVAVLRRYRQFRADYAIARAAWLVGEPAVFPFGTYWLRRFANVPCQLESG